MAEISTRGSGFGEIVRDWARNVFYIGLIPTVGLIGYLLYGLFTGQLANTAHNKLDAHAVELISQLSTWLNISLVVTLIASLFIFYEYESFGIILVSLAAFLAFGLRFVVEFLFSSDSARLTAGHASQALFQELRLAAIIIGAPGAFLVIRDLITRIVDSRSRQDLTHVTYGKEVGKQEDRPQALIGAFAACWQLPFCRDGIRVKCPIYHARTKCWKERVGCMCEENIILLAMGGEDKEKGHDMTGAGSGGFVPIGDLLTQNAEKTRAAILTRPGPRGVRIPTNPHISDAAKRERCRNCVIYNEHQRQKYSFLSGPVTLIVPVLVFWQFQTLLSIMGSLLSNLDSIIAHFSFTGQSGGASEITRNLSGNLPVETVLIICMTLVLMTWAQRFLEFCVFKIKI